ncbi:MAG: hypothetical protein HY290_01580 [Planctomycetia bacterium]|nr:hypothetical protein [Planctomycetia bacterium]
MSLRSRREFLADVGRGMLVASVGSALATDMGLSSAQAFDAPGRLNFGALESLVSLMQDTDPEKLLPQLAERYRGGTDLRTLVAAGALANARSFGGEDYIGFHTFMALAPAFEMARELPESLRPLPVFKVLYRNAARIQAVGGVKSEVLHPVEAAALPANRQGGELLQELTRKGDTQAAEGAFAAMMKGPAGEAYQHLQYEVQDEVDVHRVVLSWRAWSMRDVAGEDYAHTLLRQSLRYCLKIEQSYIGKNQPTSAIRQLLPQLFDQYKLLSKPIGKREAEDAWIDDLSKIVYSATRERAADAVAAALAEGFSPESIGEALSLAANRLVLHDPGRRPDQVQGDKITGSCHGDSVGVHASDSANAWRNIARASNPRNVAASLIVGAFHTAGQAGRSNPEPYPLPEQLAEITTTSPEVLLSELDRAIRAREQFRACAIATRYAESGGSPRLIFDRLLRYATSEDGALHAEKYYRTVSEEFSVMRPAFRWRQIAALARVSASEYGTPAPGYTQAKELFKV